MLVRSIKYFSRRSVFVGGWGFVAGSVLSSCAVSRPAPSRTEVFSSSPSPTEEPFWDDKDRSGEVKYWEFQAVGKFIPGTREHRAWGVPIPRPYQSSNEYIVSNVWSALGFWVSALNYLLLTGEAELLKVIDPELKTARPDIVKLYEDETGWVISPDNFPIKAELLAPQPAETSEDSKVFTWSARLNVDADALVFYQTRRILVLWLRFWGYVRVRCSCRLRMWRVSGGLRLLMMLFIRFRERF